jgi:hypothetical protein
MRKKLRLDLVHAAGIAEAITCALFLRWRLGSAPRSTSASPASGHTSPTALAMCPAWSGCPAKALRSQAERGAKQLPWGWTCAADEERVGPSQATRQEGLGKGGLGHAGAGGCVAVGLVWPVRAAQRQQPASNGYQSITNTHFPVVAPSKVRNASTAWSSV